MRIGFKSKQYGLIKPKKLSKKPKCSAFASADEDEETMTEALQSAHSRTFDDKKTQKITKDALKEDPAIFQYDDWKQDDDKTKEARQKREIAERREGVRKKPRYIKTLLEKAKVRERERERIENRMAVREQEKEKHLYGDKETFVTSAYKRKLEEDRLAALEEEKQAKVEALNDVTKREDLSDFYENLYRKRFGDEPKPVAVKKRPLEKAEEQTLEEPAQKRKRTEEPVVAEPQGTEEPTGMKELQVSSSTVVKVGARQLARDLQARVKPKPTVEQLTSRKTTKTALELAKERALARAKSRKQSQVKS